MGKVVKGWKKVGKSGNSVLVGKSGKKWQKVWKVGKCGKKWRKVAICGK